MLTVRRRRVVVNLVTGEAIVGERAWSWPWRLVLVNALLHPVAGQSTPVDGHVRVPWSRVSYLQVVG